MKIINAKYEIWTGDVFGNEFILLTTKVKRLWMKRIIVDYDAFFLFY